VQTLDQAFEGVDARDFLKACAKQVEDNQAAAVAHVPAVMWGQFTIPAGYRDRLRNLPRAAYPMFWDVEL
jgi:hypothetical protein